MIFVMMDSILVKSFKSAAIEQCALVDAMFLTLNWGKSSTLTIDPIQTGLASDDVTAACPTVSQPLLYITIR